jgi:putative transposase
MSNDNDSKASGGNLSRPERRQAMRAASKSTLPELHKTLEEDGLSALAAQVALDTLQELMDDDVNQACGVMGKWEQNPEDRHGYRNGWVPGVVWIGGRPLRLERPRAVERRGRKDLLLPSYQAAQDPEFLSESVLTTTVLGISLRKYRPTIEANFHVGDEQRVSCGLSKSAVGRRFIKAADRFVEQYMNRPLDQRFLVVWLDGVSAGEMGFICAVGLTATGEKTVLGLRQGSTENSALCSEFLDDLAQRGFSAQQGVLFVVDGSSAITKALRETFGADVLIQRCQVHKKRNLMAKLPDAAKDAYAAGLAEVYRAETSTLAIAKAELLARSLEAQKHNAAADSLREGGPELFTCCRLGIPVQLWCSLTNTNVIESAFSIYEGATHRVKRWRNGKQVVRWAAVSLHVAEKAFGSIGDPELLSKLASALAHASACSVNEAKAS